MIMYGEVNDKDKITKYEDGVAKNGNDEIVVARSDFVKTYMISENYLYTIKNFNYDGVNPAVAFWDHLTSFLGAKGNLDNKRGMIAVFHEDSGGLGHYSDNLYKESEKGYIEADAESKKLEIKRMLKF